jgi:adenylosuccinate lyase
LRYIAGDLAVVVAEPLSFTGAAAAQVTAFAARAADVAARHPIASTYDPEEIL